MRLELLADCSRCAGLCCVALPFSRSADFPVDKGAGEPCGNLQSDFRCGIHDRLRPEGYVGCTVFDCFGAGQQVTQVTFANQDWRSDPDVAGKMFAVFPVMRRLHELLWYVEIALGLPTSDEIRADLQRVLRETVALTRLPSATLTTYDVGPHRSTVNQLLRQASSLARASHRGPDLAGADLMGRDLRYVALVGASLRGALLTGADLRGVSLTSADLTGADLRGAKVSDADLSEALFVTQSQLDAARGNAATGISDSHTRPMWWGST